jgi:hypothetical protein
MLAWLDSGASNTRFGSEQHMLEPCLLEPCLLDSGASNTCLSPVSTVLWTCGLFDLVLVRSG